MVWPNLTPFTLLTCARLSHPHPNGLYMPQFTGAGLNGYVTPEQFAATMLQQPVGRRVAFNTGFNKFIWRSGMDANISGIPTAWPLKASNAWTSAYDNFWSRFHAAGGTVDLVVHDDEGNPSMTNYWDYTQWQKLKTSPLWSSYELNGKTMTDWERCYGVSLSSPSIGNWSIRDHQVAEVAFFIARDHWQKQFLSNVLHKYFPNAGILDFNRRIMLESYALRWDGNIYSKDWTLPSDTAYFDVNGPQYYGQHGASINSSHAMPVDMTQAINMLRHSINDVRLTKLSDQGRMIIPWFAYCSFPGTATDASAFYNHRDHCAHLYQHFVLSTGDTCAVFWNPPAVTRVDELVWLDAVQECQNEMGAGTITPLLRTASAYTDKFVVSAAQGGDGRQRALITYGPGVKSATFTVGSKTYTFPRPQYGYGGFVNLN